MKKNMLAVLILVVLIVNLTLTAYMMFTVLPNQKRTDELITRIMQIIDLELQSPLPQNVNISYTIEDIEKVELDEVTTSLKIGDDNKAHYAVINSSLTINTKDGDYAKLNPKVEAMKSDITAIIIKNVQKYSIDELRDVELQDKIKSQILLDIQTLFGSRFIVDCTVYYLLN